MNLTEHAWATRDMTPHIAALFRLARGADNIIEFGVRTGVSTWALLDALSPTGRLHSYDIEPRCFHDVPLRVSEDHRWVFHGCDSLEAERPPVSPDVVFIDTSHTYRQTSDELLLAADWGARLIVLHDWMVPDVQDAIVGFCSRTDHRIAGIEESQWGMAWLRPR